MAVCLQVKQHLLTIQLLIFLTDCRIVDFALYYAASLDRKKSQTSGENYLAKAFRANFRHFGRQETAI